MTDQVLELIKLGADVAILPLLGMIYSVQGRLSKIEGQFSTLCNILIKKGTDHE